MTIRQLISSWFTFKGRATRREYWVFTSVCAVSWCGTFAFLYSRPHPPGPAEILSMAVIWVMTLLAFLAAAARRLGDIGALYLGVIRGTAGENSCGPDPREMEA